MNQDGFANTPSLSPASWPKGFYLSEWSLVSSLFTANDGFNSICDVSCNLDLRDNVDKVDGALRKVMY